VRLLWLVVFLAATSPAFGRFVGVDVERVPVARLIENLQQIAKDNPTSVEAQLNLGRAHGMAYAQKSDPLTVPKAYHGMEPPAVSFGHVTTTADATLGAAAQAHLEAALKAYRQASELDKDNLVIHLGLAWLTEQAGRKDDAVKQYRTIAAEAWEKEKDLTMLGLGGQTLTGEVASYLVPLLDAEKDKREIETLKDHVATLGKLPYPVTPIAVPLADGLTAADLEAPDARVTFDVDGSGLGREWSWITPKAAWLVSDLRRDGKINSGRQLFGNVTFWMFWNNGYAPLAALDDNRDGILTGNELADLALWRDANGNGVAEPAEVKPLSAYGIVALSYKWQTLNDQPDQIAFSPNGVVFQDGKTRPTFDLVLKAQLGFPATFRALNASGNSP
jgi:tetratricopeptide (TPR) repeat protein